MIVFVLSSMLGMGLGLRVSEIVAPLRHGGQTLLNVRSVMAVFGTGGILAGVVFLGVGVATGWALGGSTRDTRSVRASRSWSAASEGGRILIATWRFSFVSVARNTCPMPPSPICAATS